MKSISIRVPFEWVNLLAIGDMADIQPSPAQWTPPQSMVAQNLEVNSPVPLRNDNREIFHVEEEHVFCVNLRSQESNYWVSVDVMPRYIENSTNPCCEVPLPDGPGSSEREFFLPTLAEVTLPGGGIIPVELVPSPVDGLGEPFPGTRSQAA